MANYVSSFANGEAVDAELTKVANSNLSATHKITRSATLVIAASDSSAKSKAQADYVCDGVDDQIQIRAAITELPVSGTRTIKLMGTFYKNDVDPIIIPSYTNIELDGVICFGVLADGAVMFSAVDATRISIIGGKLNGNGFSQSAGYRILVSLTNVTNSVIDTYMTNVAVATGTATATVNGAYVQENGVCYGNQITNRKYPNILQLTPTNSALSIAPGQHLVSNCDSGWSFAGTTAYSTSEYLTCGSSLQLPGTGAYATLQLSPAIDFTKATIHALVKFDSIAAGTAVSLKLRYITNSVSNYIIDEIRIDTDAVSNRWMHIVFTSSGPGARTTAGSYNEKKVTGLMMTLSGLSSMNAYIDKIWYTYSNETVLSFSFDDGFTEAKTAYGDILDKYGLKGVWGVNPTSVGTETFLTLDQLKTLQNAGHEIINHTWSHKALTYNSEAACEDEALAGQDWLISQGFVDGARFLMLPYTGKMSTAGLDVLKNHMYFSSTYPHINPLPELPYPYIYRYTPSSVIQCISAIDELQNKGGWLVLYTHSPTAGDLSSADFEIIVQYVIANNIHVATFSEVMDSYSRAPITKSTVNDWFFDVKAVSASHVCNNIDVSSTVPITFDISAQPDVPRALSGHFDSHAEITAYAITIIGIDARGRPITETITEVSGWDWETNNAFAKITSIQMTARTGTGTSDTMDVGITDSLGLSKSVCCASDIFKIKKNNKDVAVVTADVNSRYGTWNIGTIELADGDDFAISYTTI